MHILRNRHEYGTSASTLKLLKQCQKGTVINIWESIYIQAYSQHNLLVPEQNSADHNPLFNLTRILRHTDTVTDGTAVTQVPSTEQHNTTFGYQNRKVHTMR
jgi:hypothetical protein